MIQRPEPLVLSPSTYDRSSAQLIPRQTPHTATASPEPHPDTGAAASPPASPQALDPAADRRIVCAPAAVGAGPPARRGLAAATRLPTDPRPGSPSLARLR